MTERATPELSRAELTRIFFKIGCLSWGGGGANLAMLHSEFCELRPLVTEEEFQLLFGLSRLAPGMNLLSLTVLLGHRFHGLAGAFLALFALTLPSFLIIIGGCYLLSGKSPDPRLTGAIRGLSAAVVALLMQTALQMGGSSFRKEARSGRLLWLAICLSAAALALSNGLQPALIIVGGGALGGLLHRRLGGARSS